MGFIGPSPSMIPGPPGTAPVIADAVAPEVDTDAVHLRRLTVADPIIADAVAWRRRSMASVRPGTVRRIDGHHR